MKLKAGDRVVFLPMGGIWGELQWLTGTIKKKNKDPLWRYDVEIDLPHLLYPGTDHMRKNDYVTCVGPTAIVHLKQMRKEDVPKLNRGNGPDGILPKMSKLCALRRLWYEILAMDEKMLASTELQHGLARAENPELESESSSWWKSEKKNCETGIARSTETIAKFTAKIEKLKAKGAVEPPTQKEKTDGDA